MAKPARLMDTLSFIFSLVVILLAALWLWQSGTFNITLGAEENVIWYLIRSAGITSYILLTISVVWGLAISSRVVKDWSPGVLSMLLHSTVSWLGIALALGHAALLMFDEYFTYALPEIFVPFTGPYRPVAVGLGTLAFWVMFIVAVSFAFKKRFLGHKTWKRLHYFSYGSYLLATVHGLSAGSDAGHLGFRILMIGSVVLTVILLGYRIGIQAQQGSKQAKGKSASRRSSSKRTTSRSSSRTAEPAPSATD